MIFKFHLEDPLIVNTEKIRLNDMLNFLLQQKFPEHTFFVCNRPDKELTNTEKQNLVAEPHGNISSEHFGENKTIERLRENISWNNMEDKVIDFIKKCDVCQRERLMRIRPKIEAAIPDVPVAPNDKIAMDIFGPLPVTQSRKESPRWRYSSSSGGWHPSK